MTLIVVGRKLVEENIDAAVESSCNLAEGRLPDPESKHVAFENALAKDRCIVLCTDPKDVDEQPVVVIPIPIPKLFTWVDPTTSVERLRPFFRGALRSAVAIWSKERKYGRDFDLDGIFYRRPYSSKDELWHQTAVLVDVWHHLKSTARPKLHDLALVSFGHSDEGMPQLKDFKSVCSDEMTQALSTIAQALETLKSNQLAPLREIAPSVPLVTTLEEIRVPAWYSYEQWMRRLSGSAQEAFIKSPLTGPQRVDGPAGSGKTLSLVLKCLFLLKEAKKQGKPHHSALVVFSEDTKRKILESFVDPLDEDGFHTKDRKTGVEQTLTVTTLLEWSKKELEPVVGTFALSADNAAQARVDQQALVRDTLDRHLAGFVKGGGSALSQDMRTLCMAGVSPVLVEMFLHEFGVVIKGMADGSLRRYLTTNRPVVALPCRNEADRRFVFALYEKYEELLREYEVVDLDDVAVSHIKLLQMPLRRETQQGLAFDSVFVDEAHSFNPNELAIFFLLTRRAELPPLVVAVDLPQGLSDKGYEGSGLENAMFEDLEARESVEIERFSFEDIRRCPQSILDLVGSIYAQGHKFLSPDRSPKQLQSARTDKAPRPVVRQYTSEQRMLEGALFTAEEMVERLHCHRSEVVIVLMYEGLDHQLPQRLVARSEALNKRSDVEAENKARQLNHFVIARPEYLHGLEYAGVVIAGVSRDEIPRFEQGPVGGGAAAMFETQRVVDLLYLALTRARNEAAILCVRAPSFLLETGLKNGLVTFEKMM